MKAYAARDIDGTLAFFTVRPERVPRAGIWDDLGKSSMDWSLDEDPLPELTWKDEPVEVEIVVRRVDHGQ